MASDLPLDTLAGSIKVRLTKSDNMLIAAGQELIEARQRVAAGEAGEDVDWKRWLAIHQIGEEKAKVCLRIANDPNPEQALVIHQENTRQRVAAHRSKPKPTGSYVTPDQSEPVTKAAPTILDDVVQATLRPWPTPLARDWKGPGGRAYKGEGLDLPMAALSVIPKPEGAIPIFDVPPFGGDHFGLRVPPGKMMEWAISPEGVEFRLVPDDGSASKKATMSEAVLAYLAEAGDVTRPTAGTPVVLHRWDVIPDTGRRTPYRVELTMKLGPLPNRLAATGWHLPNAASKVEQVMAIWAVMDLGEREKLMSDMLPSDAGDPSGLGELLRGMGYVHATEIAETHRRKPTKPDADELEYYTKKAATKAAAKAGGYRDIREYEKMAAAMGWSVSGPGNLPLFERAEDWRAYEARVQAECQRLAAKHGNWPKALRAMFAEGPCGLHTYMRRTLLGDETAVCPIPAVKAA